jgi:3,5-epimerase/4-reductase
MSTLILGKGFVGSHLESFLKENDHDCFALSQAELNYTDPNELSDFLDRDRGVIRTVINCSGYTGVPNVDACEDNKELCFNYNVAYPLQVLKICEQRNLPVIHIGSGCIYSGYEKEYTEDDTPNFGIFSDESSYYSKCKHIFETFAKHYECYVLRIRIPFTADWSRKNYFSKLVNYNTLINEKNSITSITDFNRFIIQFIDQIKAGSAPCGIYNVVNPEPITAKEVVEILNKHNLNNPNWTFIDTKCLNTKANRSNCTLSTNKIKKLGLMLPNTLVSLYRDISKLSLQQ